QPRSGTPRGCHVLLGAAWNPDRPAARCSGTAGGGSPADRSAPELLGRWSRPSARAAHSVRADRADPRGPATDRAEARTRLHEERGEITAGADRDRDARRVDGRARNLRAAVTVDAAPALDLCRIHRSDQ